MPPKRHISLGTIPTSKPSSRPSSRHIISRGPPDLDIEQVPEPPAVGVMDVTPQVTNCPQKPSAQSRSDNENVLQAAAEACQEITDPVNERVVRLENSFPGLVVANEDAMARLAAMEDLLRKSIEQPRTSVEDVVTLRGDVNRVHELNSNLTRSIARIEETLAKRKEIGTASNAESLKNTVPGTLNKNGDQAPDQSLDVGLEGGHTPGYTRDIQSRSNSRHMSRSYSRSARSHQRSSPLSGIRVTMTPVQARPKATRIILDGPAVAQNAVWTTRQVTRSPYRK